MQISSSNTRGIAPDRGWRLSNSVGSICVGLPMPGVSVIPLWVPGNSLPLSHVLTALLERWAACLPCCTLIYLKKYKVFYRQAKTISDQLTDSASSCVLTKGQTIYIVGHLGEFVDFTNTVIPSEPIEINCLEILSINSIGIRNLLTLIRSIGAKKFYYTHCSLQFIETIDTFEILLGLKGNGRVESLYLEWVCPNCRTITNLLNMVSGMLLKDGKQISLGIESCPRCACYLRPTGDLNDIFDFLSAHSK